MGRPFRVYLNADKVYACGNCRTHMASSAELVSKHFHSKSGRAYLFHTACNVVGGTQEHRMMTTGKHVVCDIFCAECMSCVGWQYIFAFEESQKYKEGMCILERAMVVDFDKTSPAASLARASSSLSTVSSGGLSAGMMTAGGMSGSPGSMGGGSIGMHMSGPLGGMGGAMMGGGMGGSMGGGGMGLGGMGMGGMGMGAMSMGAMSMGGGMGGGSGGYPMLMMGEMMGASTLFAADDSGSDDEEEEEE